MKASVSNRLIWFGVVGGAIAWAVQFVANLMLTFAQCEAPPGRWQLPLHGSEIGISAAAIIVVLAAEGVSGWLFLSTYQHDHVSSVEREGGGSAAPTGRINSLSMMGLLVNFLVLAITIMTAIGAPLLPVCQQS